MKSHELKVWPEHFEALSDGRKKFEVRKNDRDFREGDRLLLREFDPASNEYTGRGRLFFVRYLLPGGQFGISPDFCVMSLGLFIGYSARIEDTSK